MTGPDDFTPRLGRIRDIGKPGGGRAKSQLKRAIARLKTGGKKSVFSGKRYGAGGAARTRARATRHLERQRVRRVVVKVHIARAGKSGAAVYRMHVGYIQRDGVERDGSGGRLYDRERDDIEPKKFLERGENDRHQFRLVVSPEDGAALGDLKPAIRELMAQVEKDTARRLDWVAVDHHNTGHPHTHVVVRGRDARMKDVIIVKDYLMQGIREAAEDIVTRRLGPRRDLEILRAGHSEIDKDRFTGIDRTLDRTAKDRIVIIEKAQSEADRFDRHLALARLRHLKSLGLADKSGPDEWVMKQDWTETLRDLGRRGDVVRTLARENSKHNEIGFAESRSRDAAPLIGSVLVSGPEDELRDTRYLLVEGFDGRVWHVPAAAVDQDNAPPVGAVVEVRRTSPQPRRADRTIAAIAERSGGLWSDDLHADADPSSTSAYRLAHKRRLETLRRAGIVERLKDGRWQVPEDYLERAAAYEGQRGKGLKLRTLSWLSLEEQVELRADAWLDQSDLTQGRPGELQIARMAYLRREGLLRQDESRLSDKQRATLRQGELLRAASDEASRSGRQYVVLEAGDAFKGRVEKHVDLGQGRMALIGHEKAFVLVPWKSAFGRQLGRDMMIEQTARGIGWTIGRELQRGMGR